MNDLWTLTEAHVDWITATAGTGGNGPRLLDYGAKLLQEEREKGNYGRVSNFEGYHGTQSNSLFVGWRLDGACIRLGGGMARHRWRELVEQSENVSRLDLAVSAKREPPNAALALEYWNALPPGRTGAGHPTEYSLIQTRYSGSTLYCGRRASERFGRIYDKHAESKGHYPPGTWRFEIEYKGQAAKEVSAYLRQHANVDARIAGLVERRFLEWKIITPWSNVDYSWLEDYRPPKTDNESRMKWLREQVKLSLEKLSASYTADELRLALGLQFGREDANAVYAEVMKARSGKGADFVQQALEHGKEQASTYDRDRSKPNGGPFGPGNDPQSAGAELHRPASHRAGSDERRRESGAPGILDTLGPIQPGAGDP
jgi:hypothetical protein